MNTYLSLFGVIAIKMRASFFENHLQDIFSHFSWHIIEDDDVHMLVSIYVEPDIMTKEDKEALALLLDYLSRSCREG